jgi:hypothetical protein
MKPQSQSARAAVRRARKTIVAENAGLRADLERERRVNAIIVDRLVQRLEEATAELSTLRDKKPAVTVVWPPPPSSLCSNAQRPQMQSSRRRGRL